jgi:catechol 2,3-dioxygenase-like lactoylglutathione lyase family enzyme
MNEAATASKADSILKLKFLSHGTLECKDIAFTRRFYEDFLGFEVVQTSPISIWARLGGRHVYVCVQARDKAAMPLLGHNGIDVESDEQVRECHRLVITHAAEWKLHKITQPTVQHGSFSFYFWDADENCWEILSNPVNGYSWMFERGDQAGRGHMARDFARPDLARAKAP